jgi:dTDP-glucose 4,6-dehydratase
MTRLNVVVTGGAGFIGSAVVRHFAGLGHSVTNIDKLTYAGNLASVECVADRPNYRFLEADICDAEAMGKAFAAAKPDAVIHLAAETHVDRSIDDPLVFIRTNVLGTAVLLETALAYLGTLAPGERERFRFLHVSTDEVFGQLDDDGAFVEESPYRPRSPYAASKAGADHLVRSWGETYGLPVIVTNSSNNYGPYQFPEKVIPTVIRNALAGDSIPVYGDGRNVRDWIHVEDHTRAIAAILERAAPGRPYNIGAGNQVRNIDLVNMICAILDELAPRAGGAPHGERIAFVADRPGHDYRYAIDSKRLTRELGWAPEIEFSPGLRDTVAWYMEHREWLSPARQSLGRLGLSRSTGRALPTAQPAGRN